jgi:predicted TIM-barrel fold metal-dependent hydrolase
MAYQIVRFPFEGTVDADGHILEPADLWERYLEDRYRPRAMRIRVDADGLEYLEIDGRASKRTTKGSLGMMGAMGEENLRPSRERRYMTSMPLGAADARERIELLDRENLEKALLYPTIGLLWECELTDPEITLAYQRAYNRWIADFCRDSRGRLVPIAHLTLLDPEGSARELERAVLDGCKGAFLAPFNHDRLPHGHPRYDPIYAKAAELDVPLALHPTFVPGDPAGGLFQWDREKLLYPGSIFVRAIMQQAFVSFFAYGTFDRFPTLRLGVLESGCGWIGSFLDRLDAVGDAMRLPTATRPSDYFRRQCFISGDPDETAAPHIIDHVGADLFMWATDYPHPDHPGTWVHALERFVKPLGPETRRKLLGGNVKRIYRLQ